MDQKALSDGAEEKEKTESQLKIEEIKMAALVNMRRKISSEQTYAGHGWDKLKKYHEICSAARNLRKISTQEDAAKNNGRRQRSKSVLHDAPFKKVSSRKISEPQRPWPKLPAIIVEGRARSSTVGCVDEARSNGLRSSSACCSDGKDRRDEIDFVNNEIKTVAKFTEEKDSNLLTECGLNKNHNFLTVDTMGSEEDACLKDENEKRAQEIQGDDEISHLSRLDSSLSSLSQLGDSKMGHKRIPRTNLQNEEVPKLDLKSPADDSLPSIPSISNKVKDFMNKSQPKAPPQSLKISKELFYENAQRRRPHSDHLPQIRDRNKADMLFNSNLCLNPFVKSDGHEWHYTDKYGKCRYLRVPPTPVLSIEEIFEKDGQDDGGKHNQQKIKENS